MLCENLHIQLEVVKTLNSAILLQVDSGSLEYDCLEVMDEVFSSWLDLTDQPISHLYVEYFTDDSSFVLYGTHFSRYAVVALDTILKHIYCWSGPLHKKLSTLLSLGYSSSLQECG
jgi:hypothetical protein